MSGWEILCGNLSSFFSKVFGAPNIFPNLTRSFNPSHVHALLFVAMIADKGNPLDIIEIARI